MPLVASLLPLSTAARSFARVLRGTRALVGISTLAATSFAQAADLPQVRVDTNLGSIVIELESERAPRTVENFLGYVDDGFYNGTLFHRVIEGFMVQGGGFTESYMRKQTRAPIRNEANNGLSNRTFTIAMARTNEPHSATAQFFINTVDNGNLDHTSQTPRGWGYTVFGRVVDGFDVVTAISETPTGSGGPFSRDAPRDAIIITSATRLLPAPAGAEESPAADPTSDAPSNAAATN